MDSLIDALSATQVTLEPNSVAAEHPRFSSLYKAKRNLPSQEERRRRFLETQKLNRYDFASHARNLATNEWEDGDEAYNNDDENENDDMEWEAAPRKPPRSYKNQLMLSEWLVEVPSDFEEEWLLMPCPVGKRCLVVASRGSTKAYSKGGYMLNNFPSLIPGGNRNSGSSYSLLDCVYNEVEKTYFILDVMCWNSHPYFECETQFRFYWIFEKVGEISEVKDRSKINPYKFLPLPSYPCKKDTIKETLWAAMPFSPKLDGLLFYHQRTHYTSGSTPLVGWLKAFMVPEMLNIEVPDGFNSEKPATYTSMQEHVPKAFEINEKRKAQDEKVMQCEET